MHQLVIEMYKTFSINKYVLMKKLYLCYSRAAVICSVATFFGYSFIMLLSVFRQMKLSLIILCLGLKIRVGKYVKCREF